jgi:paraquat-inducible protein B
MNLTPEAPDLPPERSLPRAIRLPARRLSAAWILPLLALAFTLFVGWRAWVERGPRILVRLRDGHGLQAGAALRYRGIQIGAVEELRLSPELDQVRLAVRLTPEAAGIAREGARFWLVRPQLSLEGVSGLETLIGANYLAVAPGPPDAQRASDFTALEQPPLEEELLPGGLFLTLEAARRYGLAPGAPLSWRDFRVGSVLGLRLSSDASAVEIEVYVRPEYRQLVREDSRFYETGGVELDFALTRGLHLELSSLQSLLVGGIALATPTRPGPPVASGHRFELHPRGEKEWLGWRPSLPVGALDADARAGRPELLEARLAWRPRRWLAGERTESGWLLPLGESLVGPRELLVPPEKARAGGGSLSLAGQPVEAGLPPAEERGPLARLAWRPAGSVGFPPERVDPAPRAGDWLVLAAPGQAPLAITASRLSPEGEGWRVQGGADIGSVWHGAAVVERHQGRLVGILLASKSEARVVPIPADWLRTP